MIETYYGVPVTGEGQIYYGTPVESTAQIYYGIPVDSVEANNEGWTFITIAIMNAENASADIKNTPGNYDGYAAHRTLSGYKYVRLVGVSGAWNDGGSGLAWRSFINCVTAVDFGFLGIHGLSGNFSTYEWAAAAWKGSSLELTLGDDGLLCWGISDPVPEPDYGVVSFEIWAKPE